LNQDAAKLATNAANIAKQYGVGIEIDYEQDSGASMGLLTTFVKVFKGLSIVCCQEKGREKDLREKKRGKGVWKKSKGKEWKELGKGV
jgi:hypothetical protein